MGQRMEKSSSTHRQRHATDHKPFAINANYDK